MANNVDPDGLQCLIRSGYQILGVSTLIGPDKNGYRVNIFLISPQKHMLWVLIRSASVSYFSTKTYVVVLIRSASARRF